MLRIDVLKLSLFVLGTFAGSVSQAEEVSCNDPRLQKALRPALDLKKAYSDCGLSLGDDYSKRVTMTLPDGSKEPVPCCVAPRIEAWRRAELQLDTREKQCRAIRTGANRLSQCANASCIQAHLESIRARRKMAAQLIEIAEESEKVGVTCEQSLEENAQRTGRHVQELRQKLDQSTPAQRSLILAAPRVFHQ